MVKSVLGVNHQGLRDWVIQRLSAVFMAIYTMGLIGFLVFHPGLSYAEWHHLFAQLWVKIATIFFLLCLMFHAWIGMWTIFTDYIKLYLVRSVLHLFVIIVLAACFIWGVMILWSV